MMKVVFDMETGDPDDVLTLALLCGHPKRPNGFWAQTFLGNVGSFPRTSATGLPLTKYCTTD